MKKLTKVFITAPLISMLFIGSAYAATEVPGMNIEVQIAADLANSSASIHNITCGAALIGSGGVSNQPIAAKGFTFKVNYFLNLPPRTDGKLVCSVWVLNKYGNKLYHYDRLARIARSKYEFTKLIEEIPNNYLIKLHKDGFEFKRKGSDNYR